MNPSTFEVTGGKPLKGAILPQGAKNEALQVISATLLTQDEVEISNIPDILDVYRQIELLKGLGVEVESRGPGAFAFRAREIDLDFFQSDSYQELARRIRGSVMLIGPLLARFGKAYLPKPGGDKIGRRRLDTHFHGLEDLGGQFNYNAEQNHFFIEAKNLKGANILMDEISVTGTANIVMAVPYFVHVTLRIGVWR